MVDRMSKSNNNCHIWKNHAFQNTFWDLNILCFIMQVAAEESSK